MQLKATRPKLCKQSKCRFWCEKRIAERQDAVTISKSPLSKDRINFHKKCFLEFKKWINIINVDKLV